MRPVVLAGLAIGLASVAYAHDNDMDGVTHASWGNSATKAFPGKADLEPKGGDEPLSVPESEVVNALHAANRTEVAAGKLAAKNADSPAVKHYARLLVRNHTAADRKLEDFAKRRSFSLTGVAHDVSDLEGMKGAAFEGAFIALVIENHREAISLIKQGQVTCKDKELRAILDRALPTLELHQREALRLQRLSRKS